MWQQKEKLKRIFLGLDFEVVQLAARMKMSFISYLRSAVLSVSSSVLHKNLEKFVLSSRFACAGVFYIIQQPHILQIRFLVQAKNRVF